MKFERIVFSAIFIALVSLTLVNAVHTPVLSMNPVQWSTNTAQDVFLVVSNDGVDGITVVELVVPETENSPDYEILEVSKPAGWTYDLTTKTTEEFPYKITWTTSGSGISSDSGLSFGFKATSPSHLGEYKWTVKTVDSKGSSLENHLMTSTGLAPLGSFDITGEPKETKAGRSFTITVKAYDTNKNIKTDYTGKVVFGSTDEKSVLPSSYTFKNSDNGVKSFSVKLKTVGERVILVADEQAGVSKISDVIMVDVDDFVSLKILPDNLNVGSGTKVEFTAFGTDLYDNSVDVSEDVSWDVDDNAEGRWEQNVYTSDESGIWSVTGRYLGLRDGTFLLVQEKVVQQPEQPTVPEIPTTPEVPEEQPEEPPVIEITPTAELTVSSSDTVVIEEGKNDTLILTVENTGNTDLTKVSVSYIGVPEDWIEVIPQSEDLEVGESREFLVTITVPENTSETKTVTFTVTSNEGASSAKEVTLYAGEAPTGIFIGFSKNLLQLAVVIIAIATVIIIVWELWFRK